MESVSKLDLDVVKSIVTEEQLVAILKLHSHFDGEDKEIKVIRKAVKKLDKPNFENIAEKIKKKFGRTKLRRLLDKYDGVEWQSEFVKQEGKGRPMKIYKRIK